VGKNHFLMATDSIKRRSASSLRLEVAFIRRDPGQAQCGLIVASHVLHLDGYLMAGPLLRVSGADEEVTGPEIRVLVGPVLVIDAKQPPPAIVG